jgi:NAD-dependent DNA ligase
MARVVQRRSNPPYLLFVFVFLFLVAATLAVIGFMKADETEQKVTRLENETQELQSERDTLAKESADLVEYITGVEGSTVEGIQAAESARETTDLRTGLAVDIKNLYAELNERDAQVQELKNQLDTRLTEIGDSRTTFSEERDKWEARLTELEEEKQAIQAKLSTSQEDYEKRMEQHTENLEKVRSDLQEEIEEKNNQIEQLVLKLQDRDEEITELRNTVEKLKTQLTPGGTDVVNLPDGQIIKAAPGSEYCYINLGVESNVRQGMTFVVYDNEAAFKEDGKGKIRVIKVNEYVSECKIVEQSSDNPIMQGDAVANIAFNTGRVYTFVVAGQFDLYNTGQASELGRQAVIDAIQQFGGRINEEINVQTDYVVMGVPPTKPTEPAPDAEATVQRAYQEQMKQYEAYSQALDKAQAMKIPVLNGKRFIELTGYMPEQRPR